MASWSIRKYTKGGKAYSLASRSVKPTPTVTDYARKTGSNNAKGKGQQIKVVPAHSKIIHRGSGGRDPLILNLVSGQRRVVSFTPRHLYRRRKTSLYPLDRGLGRPPIRSVRSTSSSKYLLPLSAISCPWPSTISHTLFQRLAALPYFDTLQHATAYYLQEVLPWQKRERENCSVML